MKRSLPTYVAFSSLLALFASAQSQASISVYAEAPPYRQMAPEPGWRNAPKLELSCTSLRISPVNGTQIGFINPQVSVAYTSPQAGACADIRLVDDSGKLVASKPVYRSEWKSPAGGVAGAITLEPLDYLWPASTYRVMRGTTVVSTFRTASFPLPRGAATRVVDQPVSFGGLPKSAVIPVAAINDLLRTFLANAIHDPALAKTAYDLVSKEVPHLAHPQARYNARVRKVSYTSGDANGWPVVLSGLLVYPENPDGSPFDFSKAGMVLGEHGSADSAKPAVSSASTADLVVGLLAAGKGQVFFAPDLIGFGETAKLPQAYLVTQDTASASQDMLLAVRRYLNWRFPTTPLGKDLRIVGGSQGGFSSLAVIPQLSQLANIKGVFAGEGPYNLEQTLVSTIGAIGGQPRDAYAAFEDLSFVPGHLLALLESYRAYEGFTYNPADIFSGKLFNPTFVQDFIAGKYAPIQAHLGLNSLVNNGVVYNAPEANVVLFHYSKDSLVPAKNSEDMLAFLNNGTHRLGNVSRGDCKEHSLFTRLFLTFSHSKVKSHLVCGVYLLDRAVADM